MNLEMDQEMELTLPQTISSGWTEIEPEILPEMELIPLTISTGCTEVELEMDLEIELTSQSGHVGQRWNQTLS